ncbi:sensor domain-containing protein [Nonomuraea rubra]|uniref:sensor domain-containing protein n=1 Tax=Nonomuraea rubra TaxID=46180 RepID=UPI00361C3602
MLRRYGRVLALLALAVVQAAMAGLTGVMLLLSFALGMVFLFPPQVMMVRELAELNRKLVREWAGVGIDRPYLPPPPPPVPQADGMYRSERTLYKSPACPPGTTGGSGW